MGERVPLKTFKARAKREALDTLDSIATALSLGMDQMGWGHDEDVSELANGKPEVIRLAAKSIWHRYWGNDRLHSLCDWAAYAARCVAEAAALKVRSGGFAKQARKRASAQVDLFLYHVERWCSGEHLKPRWWYVARRRWDKPRFRYVARRT